MNEIDRSMAEIERGRLAREVLENPIFVEAWEKLNKKLFDAWQSTAFDAAAHQIEIHRTQRAAKFFRDTLTQIMKKGDTEKFLLSQKTEGGVVARTISRFTRAQG